MVRTITTVKIFGVVFLEQATIETIPTTMRIIATIMKTRGLFIR